MFEDAVVLPQSSPLLWLLGLLVAVAAAYVAFGELRRCRRAIGAAATVMHLLLASLALGSGLWGSMVLDIASQPWSYPVGLAPLWLGAAWALAVLGAALAFVGLAWRQNLVTLAMAVVLLAPVACASEGALILGLGLEPGMGWRWTTVATACWIAAAGTAAGLWLSLLGGGRAGRRRRAWRVAAAALFGGAAVAGQEMLMGAAAMASAVGSAHHADWAMKPVSVAVAVALPPLLALLWAGRRWRRLQRGPAAGAVADAAAPGRERRRRRERRSVL
jgi:hypothetical protein